MKILHLSTSDIGGGAARGAYWLHRALSASLDSRMLVQQKQSSDPSVSEYQPRWSSQVAARLEPLPLRLYPRLDDDFSPAVLPRPLGAQLGRFAPDVVNLHWINQGFLTPEAVGRIRQPLVWTLRDLWPLTGGCHYAGDCQKFTGHCGACPALHSRSPLDLSSLLHARKRRAWRGKRFTVVALSRWLADQAARSSLLRDQEIVVIPNALDTDVFRPLPRAVARTALGLPAEAPLILFAAINPLGSPRKGFGALREAVARLAFERLALEAPGVFPPETRGNDGRRVGLGEPVPERPSPFPRN